MRIESSPFLSCLQTASAIAKANSTSGIHVEYRVSDTLIDHMFKEVQGDIFEELDLKKSGKNLQVQALGGIEVIDTEDFYGDIRTLYPEES